MCANCSINIPLMSGCNELVVAYIQGRPLYCRPSATHWQLCDWSDVAQSPVTFTQGRPSNSPRVHIKRELCFSCTTANQQERAGQPHNGTGLHRNASLPQDGPSLPDLPSGLRPKTYPWIISRITFKQRAADYSVHRLSEFFVFLVTSKNKRKNIMHANGFFELCSQSTDSTVELVVYG